MSIAALDTLSIPGTVPAPSADPAPGRPVTESATTSDTPFDGATRPADTSADTEPAPTRAVAQPPMTGAERGLLVAGGLAIVRAVLSLVSLYPFYLPGFRLVDEASITWSTVIRTVAVAVAGILLLAPGTRRQVGPGFLLGSSATSPLFV